MAKRRLRLRGDDLFLNAAYSSGDGSGLSLTSSSCKSIVVEMEGIQALSRPPFWRKLPLLAGSMFLVGMGLEVAMCLSGFYSVYTVNEAQKKAEEEVREKEFWQRVRAWKSAKQAAVTITPPEE